MEEIKKKVLKLLGSSNDEDKKIGMILAYHELGFDELYKWVEEHKGVLYFPNGTVFRPRYPKFWGYKRDKRIVLMGAGGLFIPFDKRRSYEIEEL